MGIGKLEPTYCGHGPPARQNPTGLFSAGALNRHSAHVPPDVNPRITVLAWTAPWGHGTQSSEIPGTNAINRPPTYTSDGERAQR
jgi:hypothetical protein